jgi:hypothetical protein
MYELAVVKEKQWPWVRLYHKSKKLTIYWNEHDNLIQSIPPGSVFDASSVEGGNNNIQIGNMIEEFKAQMSKRSYGTIGKHCYFYFCIY